MWCQARTLVYRCMVLSWSSGAKLTRLLASLLPFLRRLMVEAGRAAPRSPSTDLSRLRACTAQWAFVHSFAVVFAFQRLMREC